MTLKRTHFISVILACCILAAPQALCSCAKNSSLTRFTDTSLEVFDTVAVITGYDESRRAFDEKKDKILETLREYHRLYDIYTDYEGINNIKTVNDNAGVAPVQVDEKIISLLEMSIEMYNTTGGKTNVAMGSVLSLWHEYREAGLAEPSEAQLPPEDELEQAALHTDINNIVIDKAAGTVFLKDPEASIDVGATAKGYATEMCAEMCEKNGWSGYALSIGGNVRTVGTKPDGESWSIGVQNPDSTEDEPYVEKLALNSLSLVTSGSYQRYYTVDGVQYHHIINPDTLMPDNTYVSVSVVCPDSGKGDALSTALFNMSINEGLALVEGLEDTEALWLYPDGEKKTSPGFAALCTD